MKRAVGLQRSGKAERVMKALITGGAGFIGGFLAQALAASGHTVHLVDNLARGRHDRFLSELLAMPNVALLQRNLLEAHTLDTLDDDYTHVVHLAAILGVQHVLDHPYPTLRDNVQLLEGVLSWAQHQPHLERFVFASTSEVYAGSLEQGTLPIPTPEDAPLTLPSLDHPRTSYMLSKIYGEALVRHAGPPFTIIRPHNVYGPRMGQSHVIPQLLEKAYHAPDGGSIEVFSVDHRRTFCFIDDAVEMITRAATAPDCVNQVLNLGSQSPELTIGEVAEVIVRTVGKPLRVDAKPSTPGSPTRRCPDMSRMAALTGYRARTAFEDGVRRTYAWYRPMVFEGGEVEVAR
jgi:UDP-glucose 4-epimerase